MDAHWIKKFRFLIAALILSCGLNIGFLATFIFSAWDSKQAALPLISAPDQSEKPFESTYRHVLMSMSKLSFAELITFLTNQEVIEEGLAKRDLAVAALVAFHDFHLEKALSYLPAQTRQVALSAERQINVYLGLDDEQFDAIIRFAYREKWPLTAKGLFTLLKKRTAENREESLLNAFMATNEFYALQLLFQKTQASQPPIDLATMACDGSWSYLEQFVKEQSQVLDLSTEKRRQLLLGLIHQGSSRAAQIFLRTDFAFARQKLDDPTVLALISLLREKTAEAERFCIELLSAPRTDSIWKAASERLYAFAGENTPEPFDLHTALVRFTSHPKLQVQPSSPSTALRQHIVKPGENLWKIARQYKVKVEDLVSLNELEKDQLHPGMILFVP